jgi:hypothetical protein
MGSRVVIEVDGSKCRAVVGAQKLGELPIQLVISCHWLLLGEPHIGGKSSTFPIAHSCHVMPLNFP